MLKEAVEVWTVQDALELYDVEKWGKGYFSVSSNGNLLVHPSRDPKSSIDLKELIDRLQIRGLDLPILLRFNGILKDRLKEIHGAFSAAIKEHDFKGRYSCVYPIKVNQQRRVVEKIIEYGREFGFGLEAGSKPELLAVVAITDADVPIIFGVLTTHTIAQAIERSDPAKFNRGGEAAKSAIEMATVMRLLRSGEETPPKAEVSKVRKAKKRAPRKRRN